MGSFAELARLAGHPVPVNFDPHRVETDRIVFPCPSCNAPSRREPYTIDVWYDAGSAPFAQFHYPFEPGPFDPAVPLDYVAEGLDQTRGWFYTLLVLSTALFHRPAYRTSLTTGMVLDESSRKMSKSKGNAIDPIDLLERLGGDPIRWTFLTVDFTEPMRVGEATIHKAAGRTLGTLSNVVAFHLQNARADALSPSWERPEVTSLLDRWALSRLEATRVAVTASLDSSDPRPAALAVRDLVDDLSTWYVRRSRPRFWGETTPEDRHTAHATLSYLLLHLAEVVAPLLPFTAEWVHQEVGELGYTDPARSVHLGRWPSPLGGRDEALEAGMAALRDLVEVGRELRHRATVKARVPLEEFVLFGAPDPALAHLGAEGERLLAEELNVSHVRRVPATERARFPDAEWVVREEDGRPVAALPRQPTAEQREEGLAREVGRRLQHTRKELGLAPTDRVRVTLGATGELLALLRRRAEPLAHDLQADSIQFVEGDVPPGGEEVRRWDLDGIVFTATVARARS